MPKFLTFEGKRVKGCFEEGESDFVATYGIKIPCDNGSNDPMNSVTPSTKKYVFLRKLYKSDPEIIKKEI